MNDFDHLHHALQRATDGIEARPMAKAALATASRRRTRRRGAVAAVLSSGVVAAVVIAVSVGGSTRVSPAPDPASPTSTMRTNQPDVDDLEGVVLVGNRPRVFARSCGIDAEDPQRVWILSCNGFFRVVSAASPQDVRTVDLNTAQGAETFERVGDDLFVALFRRDENGTPQGAIAQIDTATETLRAEVDLGSTIPVDLYASPSGLWIVGLDGTIALLVDGELKRYGNAGEEFRKVAVSGDTIWTVAGSRSVQRRSTNDPLQVLDEEQQAKPVNELSVIDQRLWIGLSLGAPAEEIPEGQQVPPGGSVALGAVNAIEECDGQVWLSQQRLEDRARSGAGLRSVTPTNLRTERLIELTNKYSIDSLSCDDTGRLWFHSLDGTLGYVADEPTGR